MAATSVCAPRVSSRCLLPLQQTQRSAGGSDPGSFQITASSLGLRACGFCVCPLRVKSLFLTALWLSPKQAPLAFKPNILGVHLPGAGLSGWGAQCGAQTPHSLERTSAVVIILPFVCHPPGGTGLDYTKSSCLLPISLWFLLFIFSCRLLAFLINSCSVNK